VSEVGLDFNLILIANTMATEGSLQEILDRLLAGQEKREADMNAEMKAS
jgi:hypothetical protein